MGILQRADLEWVRGPSQRLHAAVVPSVWTIILGAVGSWLYVHASSKKDLLHTTLLASIPVPLWLAWLLGLALYYGVAWARCKIKRAETAQASNTTSELKAQLQRMQMLETATETLLSAAAYMTASKEQSLQNVLTSYLSSIYDVFEGRVRRLDVLVPKDTLLVSIARHRMPLENQEYDLNDTSATPGLYVHACRSKKVETAHLYEEDGEWKCDHLQYKPHRAGSQKPPHTTFVIVPMKDAEGSVKGVVCLDNDDELDANRKGIFDQPEMQPILTGIGSNLASVMALWERLHDVGS